MTTNDQENITKHKPRNLHINRILRIIIILIAAITAGSALNITISPIITTGGSVNVNETKAATPAATENNTNVNNTNRTVSAQSGNTGDTTLYISSTSHLCGHPTRKGTPCKHWVKGPGYCFEHNN